MDPLSLITGVLALLGACTAVSEKFKNVKRLGQAPALIQALNNEISDLRLALLNINDYLERVREPGARLPYVDDITLRSCFEVVEQTKNQVLELECLISYRLLKPGREDTLRVDRLAFLQEQHRLIRLQGELRNSRQRVLSLFSYFGIREASKIEVMLKDIRFDVNQTRMEAVESFSSLNERQSRLETALQEITNGPFAMRYSHLGAEARSGPNLTPTQKDTDSLIAILGKCHCHYPRERISGHLRTWLRQLFVGYAASPFAHHHQCHCTSRRELRLVYCFPLWFSKASVSFHAHYSTLAGFSTSLRVVQLLNYDHSVVDYINSGDLPAMQVLLDSGEVSIHATDPLGDSLLQASSPFWTLDVLLIKISKQSCLVPCDQQSILLNSVPIHIGLRFITRT